MTHTLLNEDGDKVGASIGACCDIMGTTLRYRKGTVEHAMPGESGDYGYVYILCGASTVWTLVSDSPAVIEEVLVELKEWG